MHQNPPAGKERGTDVNGNRARIITRDEGQSLFVVEGTLERPAEVANDDFIIQGPRIHLDQAVNYAWVKGKGKLIQRKVNERPLEVAPDKTLAAETKEDMAEKIDDDETPKLKGPLVITWDGDPETGVGMEFFGKGMAYHKRMKGRQPGFAEARFLGNVEAATDDSRLLRGDACDDGSARLVRQGRRTARGEERRNGQGGQGKPQSAEIGLRPLFGKRQRLQPQARSFVSRTHRNAARFRRTRHVRPRDQPLRSSRRGITRLYNHPGQDAGGGWGGANANPNAIAARPNVKAVGAAKSKIVNDGLLLTRIHFNDHMEGSFTVPATKGAPPGRESPRFTAVSTSFAAKCPTKTPTSIKSGPKPSSAAGPRR